MNKTFVRIIALIMCAALILGLLSMLTSVLASEVEVGNENILIIETRQDFLDFAENCRLDSFSMGLTVLLQTDLDLTDTDFSGIPIFCGSFMGNDHTISGLALTGEGSYQGLFRYLTETAVVSCLKVSGNVAPDGSACYVGAIAGSNAGRIEKCAFADGSISGADYVGGLVGINAITGVITDCTASATVHGSHFVGGLAGENKGTVKDCTNYAAVNTTTEQNSVDISDITMDTLTDSETAATVTDIGGIAGVSSGTIADCTNRGDVGYPYMGYNVGGITGSQSGFVSGCVNYASINGRKEVGGIVGQLEPYTTISFKTDTLQILKDQVADLSDTVKRFAANTDENLENINTLVTQLEQYVADLEAAADALQALVEDPQIESLEDVQTTFDTAKALLETMGNCLTGIDTTVDSLYAALKATTSQVEEDLQAVTDQVSVIESTLNHASDNLGGTVTDVSDSDTDDSTYSTVADCLNFGQILADLNVGGIVGSIAVENDLDPENDVDILGENTLNYDVNVRSVIRSCSNSAAVHARKQRAGGIVGWMSLGLAKNCVNTGPVEAASADYVGGIVGISQGFIRACNAKCALAGDEYVGGIAGEAATVSDCRSVIRLDSGTEKLGCIVGFAEDRTAIENNYYMVADCDLGGIDGISYDGHARSLSREDFLALEELSDIFRTVTLTFLFDDGTQQCLEVAMGASVSQDDIPAIAHKNGCKGSWEGLDPEDLKEVKFDAVYTVVYTRWVTVIESQQTRNEMPVLLAQGQFHSNEILTVTNIAVADALSALTFDLPQDSTVTSLRYLLPEGCDGDKILIKLRNASDGSWHTVDFTVSGSYAVVEVTEMNDALCVVDAPEDYTLYIIIGAAVLAVITAVVILVKKRKGKK